MPLLKEVSELLKEQGEQGLSRLLGDAPVLVIRPSPAEDEVPAVLESTPLDGTLDLTRETRRWERGEALEETHAGEMASPWAELAAGDSQVVPVVKSDRNLFVGLITLGRAQSCDIRLTSPRSPRSMPTCGRAPEGGG